MKLQLVEATLQKSDLIVFAKLQFTGELHLILESTQSTSIILPSRVKHYAEKIIHGKSQCLLPLHRELGCNQSIGERNMMESV